MIKRTIPCILLLAAFSSFAWAESREIDRKYLPTVLSDALLKYAHLEVASETNVVVVTNGSERCLGLRISPGQAKIHEGMRAEMSVNYPFNLGETVHYAWRFMLPKDFICDAPLNRWWLIGQWHDQPNEKRGESWNSFPSHSPPVALEIEELNGRLGVNLAYGPNDANQHQRHFGPIFLERGKWYSIVVSIHWSRGADGKVAVFLDGNPDAALTGEGPNMNNDFQHYLKLGMYRHPDIRTDNWIFIDRIEISKSATRQTSAGLGDAPEGGQRSPR